MPIVETTITVSIPETGATLGEVEAEVARGVKEAGRRLLLAACGAMEGAGSGGTAAWPPVRQVKA